MYTFRQPFPNLTLQYMDTVMNLSFTGDPPFVGAAPVAISGIPYTPGGGVLVTVPDDFVGHLTFTRQSDGKYLGQAPFDYRENPYLSIDPEVFQNLIERIEEQVPGLGPVDLIPALPLDMSDWLVLWADFYDLGLPADGVSIVFRIQGVPPFSTDAVRFEKDGVYSFISGQGYTVGTGATATVFPATEGRAWIVIPKSSALSDRTGALGLPYRIDSVGAMMPDRSEAVTHRTLMLNEGGNLLPLLIADAST